MQTNSNKTVVWSQNNCAACEQAKALLTSRGIEFEVKILGENATKQELIEAVPHARSVPHIFLKGTYVGGLAELRNALR